MRAAPTRPSVTAPIQPATVSARLLDDDVAAPFQILHAVVAGALGHLVPPAARPAPLARAGEDLAGLRVAARGAWRRRRAGGSSCPPPPGRCRPARSRDCGGGCRATRSTRPASPPPAPRSTP